jgi:hypothetical protein
MSDVKIKGDTNADMQHQIDALIKQRDMLAEALEEITNVAERVDGWECFPSGPIDRAYAALAAVKGGEK